MTIFNVELLFLNLLWGQEGVEGSVLLVLDLIIKDCMSVREGSSLNVLTGETNSETLVEKGTPGEGLSGGHINSLPGCDGLESGFENLLDLGVEGH